MVPPFDLQGGLPLCLARAAFVAALLSVFGTLVFRIVVGPRVFARMDAAESAASKRHLLIMAQGSAAAGLLAGAVWLAVQAANMADTHGARQLLGAVPEVLTGTAFGHVLMAQGAALLAALAAIGVRDREWRQRAGLGLATAALCLQVGHSHASSMYAGPSVLLVCDGLHVLGAGAWLGGLVPLLVLVWRASPRAGAAAARWFSPLGKLCVAALIVSAGFQAWVLIATVPSLVGTAYGWVALVKLALFGVLLGFAAANRYRFAPALLAARPDAAKRVLVRSIALQTGAALAIVAAAGVLSQLPPSMHEQALWPFAQRFSLDAVREDPAFRAEVLRAALAMGGAVALLVSTFILRRWRIVACFAAVVIAGFAVPHFDLLLVPAYQTSFFHSPTGFTAASIVQGQGIYAQYCVACHGADGRGDHPSVAGLAVPPADLTAPHLWMHSDGELFWWLSRGITTPEGAQAMPGFAGVLDEDERWAVIDFIRARNAGVARAEGGVWTHTVQAPDFGVTCGAATPKLSELRGRFVRLRFGAAAGIAVTLLAAPAAPSGVCFTDDQSVAGAYAVVSGLDAAHLSGSEFLIDDDGWLRAMQPADARQDWSDPVRLAAEIAALRAQKIGEDAPMKMKM